MTEPLMHDHQTDHAANRRGCWMYAIFIFALIVILWTALIGAVVIIKHQLWGV